MHAAVAPIAGAAGKVCRCDIETNTYRNKKSARPGQNFSKRIGTDTLKCGSYHADSGFALFFHDYRG